MYPYTILVEDWFDFALAHTFPAVSSWWFAGRDIAGKPTGEDVEQIN